MFRLIHIASVLAVAGIFLLLFFLFGHFFRHHKPPQPAARDPSGSRRETHTKTLFNWSDNPALATDAIENGWSRFAFTQIVSSSSVRSNRFLLASCAYGDDGTLADDVDINWEVCQGSSDFMQKIQFNSGLKKIVKTTTSEMSAASVVRSALPLPGPTLGNSSPFPQEAYFEITLMSCYDNENGSDVAGEDDNVMLIPEIGVNGRGVHVNYEELRGRSCAKDVDEEGNEVAVMLAVGLAVGGSLPVKLPGSYPGSVGFHSDGSIYLDGIKLVTDSESNIGRWERAKKVIGCGYNPSVKKVFFTLDSKCIHEINCKEDAFGSPLYPILASNSDVMILVNFGQSIFKYEPANLKRTQNPCFIGPMANSSSSGFEDSKELFSMGNLDSQWRNQTIRSGPYHGFNVSKGKTKDYDEASEGDLFEIVIERNSYRKSPSTQS
ncbi:hypothetical protein R6Q57_021072 [Mikania cordata]